jgi:hypothetical protein
MVKVRKTLEDMKVEAKFIISNKSRENEAYQREIDRMQVLDRVRQQVVTNTFSAASISQTIDH